MFGFVGVVGDDAVVLAVGAVAAFDLKEHLLVRVVPAELLFVRAYLAEAVGSPAGAGYLSVVGVDVAEVLVAGDFFYVSAEEVDVS